MEIMTKEYARTRLPELEEMCSLRPNPAHIAELASCYFTLDQPERALPPMRVAWDRSRGNSSVALNLAMILKDLGRHEESFQVVEHAYSMNPDDYYTRLAYSEALLRAGFWRAAWPIYDSDSRPTQQFAAMDLRLPMSVREWDGRTIPAGERLLVINEGGAGDRLSYARWLPELTRRGIDWIFFPYEELFPFFERIFPRERLVKAGDDLTPGPAYWTTSFSLPAKLNVSATEIPKPLTLSAEPKAIERFKIPRPDGLPIVGLCWDAAEKFQGDRKVRSLSEGQAMRLVCMTGDRVHWVSLQHGRPMPFPVSNIQFRTWEDTAGLVHNLDAVVTVDTGVMHLAGAMGKPTAVLLSGNSDWKFLAKTPKCYWYPTARLFRNEGCGFENAIDKLVRAIRSGEAW